MEESIREALEELSSIIQQAVSGSAAVITQTPAQAFGRTFWENLLHIGTFAIMPFAIVIVAYCMALELYNVYCRSNGEIDTQLVLTTVIKFILPMILIAGAYPLMDVIFTTFNKLVGNIWTALNPTIPSVGIAVDQYMETINELSWWSKLQTFILAFVARIAMYVMAALIYVIVYFRLFEIIIYWIVAPLPLATLVHHEQDQIGKNFIKMFIAVMLQGVLLILCMAMYAAMVTANVFEPTTWGLIKVVAFTAVLAFMTLKSGSMAKRLMNTF